MSHLLHAALKRPCIMYKTAFDHSELEKVKLTQGYDDGTTRSKRCPQFTGEQGIEGLLYCEHRFRSIARQFTWNEGSELFDNFEDILADNAEEEWDNLTSGIEEADRTVPRFDQTIRSFYLKYSDNEARDTMFKYIRTLTKPRDVEPAIHADRMETLIRYANQLNGTEPRLTDDQKKNIIFDTFPVKWKQNYIRSGRAVATDELADIVQYMGNEKSFSDNKEENDRKRKRENGKNYNFRGRGRGRGSGRGSYHGSNNNGNPFPNANPYSTCPIPGHGNHQWIDCYRNPRRRGQQNSQYNRQGNRTGRGGPGRGTNGGRGQSGRTNERSSYHSRGRGMQQNGRRDQDESRRNEPNRSVPSDEELRRESHYHFDSVESRGGAYHAYNAASYDFDETYNGNYTEGTGYNQSDDYSQWYP